MEMEEELEMGEVVGRRWSEEERRKSRGLK